MFGKSFDTSKFKSAINNALARIAILKKQHHSRWSQARSDAVQLLNLGHQESAILRVDHVIREQNLLDALVIIEGYSCLLLERIALIKNTIQCPEELKEAIASLIFAASRYGQLPELQKISRIFMKKYGKEFINYAVELRNSCGVNAKIAKRLPNRRTSLGTRLKVMKEIAAEHGIILQQEGENPEVNGEKMNARKTTRLEDQEQDNERQSLEDNEHPKSRNRYTDAKQAAEAACQLATQAAAAARAAVELFQTKLHDDDDGGPDDSNHQPRNATHHNENTSFKALKEEEEEGGGLHKNDAFEENFRKFSIQKSNKSFRKRNKEAGPRNFKGETRHIPAVFTSDSDADTDKKMPFTIPDKSKQMEVKAHGEKDESKSRASKHPWLDHHNWDTEKKFSSFTNEFLKVKHADADTNDNHSIEDRYENSNVPSNQDRSSRSSTEGIVPSEGSSRGRRPISVRTRRNACTPSRSTRQISVRPVSLKTVRGIKQSST